MANLIILIIIAAVAAALLVLRTNAAMVFFALCGGNVLVQFASKNMAYFNGHLNKHLLPNSYTITKPSILVVLMLAPPVLVAALAKHNNGPSKWPAQIFPAIATGVLGILFVTPLLSTSLQNSITQNKFWSILEQYQVPIVGLCVAVSLVILIMNTYGHNHEKKHHKS